MTLRYRGQVKQVHGTSIRVEPKWSIGLRSRVLDRAPWPFARSFIGQWMYNTPRISHAFGAVAVMTQRIPAQAILS